MLSFCSQRPDREGRGQLVPSVQGVTGIQGYFSLACINNHEASGLIIGAEAGLLERREKREGQIFNQYQATLAYTDCHVAAANFQRILVLWVLPRCSAAL